MRARGIGNATLPHGTDQLTDPTMARALHADACRDHALVAYPCGSLSAGFNRSPGRERKPPVKPPFSIILLVAIIFGALIIFIATREHGDPARSLIERAIGEAKP